MGSNNQAFKTGKPPFRRLLTAFGAEARLSTAGKGEKGVRASNDTGPE